MPSPEAINLIGLIAIFTLLFLGFFNPFYSLLSYFSVMMTRPGLYYPSLGRIRIELIIGLIVLLTIVLRKKEWLSRLRFEYNKVNKNLFLFFLVILLSFAQAWDYSTSWNDVVIEFLKIYAFYVMILAFVNKEKDLRIFLWAFSLLTILIDYQGLYIFFSGQESYVFRGVDVAIASEGFASGHVAAANMQLQCLPIMVYLLLSEKRLVLKLLAGIFCFLSVAGVIASGSRGGFLGLIVVAGLLVYFSKRRGPALVLCVICFFALMPLMRGSYLHWMDSIIGLKDDSATSRITGLINGIEMMIRRPILGVGPGCYPLARKAWFHWGLESHNHYGQLMGDLGVLGTIAWGYFIVRVFNNLRTAKKNFRTVGNRESSLIIIGIQSALLVRLFEGNFSHSLYIFFWYMIAALSIVLLKASEGANAISGLRVKENAANQ